MNKRICKAQVTIERNGCVENLWPGLEVDFDRELAPGVTIKQAVSGKESEWFETPSPVTKKAPDTKEKIDA